YRYEKLCESLIFMQYSFVMCYTFLRFLRSFPTRRSSDLFASVLSIGLLAGGIIVGAADSAGAQTNDLRTGFYSFSPAVPQPSPRSEEHTSELQSREKLVCRLLLEKKYPKYQQKK